MNNRDNLSSADNQQERLQLIPRDIGNYLSGFADGEGSFNISIIKRQHDYRNGWKVAASFNISQRDPTIPLLFNKIFQCGTIRYRKDGICYYEVRNVHDLNETVRFFFKQFPLLSDRQSQRLRLLLQAVDLLAKKEHLKPLGLKRVLYIREKMLSNRPRTYSIADVLKNPQRLHAKH